MSSHRPVEQHIRVTSPFGFAIEQRHVGRYRDAALESLNFLIEESRAYGQEFLNSMALVVPVNPDDPESVKAADAKRREYHFNAAKAKIREQTLRDCVKLLQQLKKYAAESE